MPGISKASPSAIRPIRRFADAVAQCSNEAAVYGRCIVADHNAVEKDKCVKEFLRLKDCYLAASKKGKL